MPNKILDIYDSILRPGLRDEYILTKLEPLSLDDLTVLRARIRREEEGVDSEIYRLLDRGISESALESNLTLHRRLVRLYDLLTGQHFLLLKEKTDREFSKEAVEEY